MTLKEMLADVAKFPDTHEIAISDGFKVTLKDLREYQSLAAAAESAARKKAEEADTLAARAADLVAQMQAHSADSTKAEPALAATPAEPDYAADPLLGPLFRRLTGIEQKVATEFGAKLSAIEKNLNAASARYLRREIEQDFTSIPDRFEDVALRDVVKFAVDNRYLDESGIPRVRDAYSAMTAERRLKKVEEDAYKRGQEEGRRSLPATEGMVLRPGLGRVAPDPQAPVHKDTAGRPSLDAAFDAIYSDRDLMNNLSAALSSGAIQ